MVHACGCYQRRSRPRRASAQAHARFGSHLGLLTAADGAHSRPSADQNAPVGSWAPAAGNGACLRARSAAVSSLRVFYAITALRDGTEKKEILGDMIPEIANTLGRIPLEKGFHNQDSNPVLTNPPKWTPLVAQWCSSAMLDVTA